MMQHYMVTLITYAHILSRHYAYLPVLLLIVAFLVIIAAIAQKQGSTRAIGYALGTLALVACIFMII